MFVSAIKIAKQAIFPIFRFDQISGSELRVRITGTGFFINSKGYFVSVAHIFDDQTSQTSFRYLGRLPEEVKPRLLITEVARDNEHDIFLGKIEINNSKYFYLAKKIPEIGKSVCICGYPLAVISQNDRGGLELGGVRRYFQPTFVLDIGKAQSRSSADQTRMHDGFLVRDFGLFGMSGGPIFDVRGIAVGIQASVTQPRVSVGSGGRTITVENALAIRNDFILKLLKGNKIRINFWGKL